MTALHFFCSVVSRALLSGEAALISCASCCSLALRALCLLMQSAVRRWRMLGSGFPSPSVLSLINPCEMRMAFLWEDPSDWHCQPFGNSSESISLSVRLMKSTTVRVPQSSKANRTTGTGSLFLNSSGFCSSLHSNESKERL